MQPPSSVTISPKRKRDASDASMDVELSFIHGKTGDIPSRTSSDSVLVGSNSPRTSMAGHMQRLDLQEISCLPELDFGRPVASQRSLGQAQGFEPDVPLLNYPQSEQFTRPSSSYGPSQPTLNLSDPIHSSNHVLDSSERPCQNTFASISPPPPAKKSPSKSPPPPSLALWWSDTEITGHNLDPSDPTDDGEGINGVGFLPTPATAYARAERRRRQVKEWKEREGREARAKRGEKRRKKNVEQLIASEDTTKTERSGRKVRFIET